MSADQYLTPEIMLEELRKMAWSKEGWLKTFGDGSKFPQTLIEVRRRELAVLRKAIETYKEWCERRAEKKAASA